MLDEEKLVLLVKEHKELYDMYDKNYSNFQRRENSWREIAEDMGAPEEKCRLLWKRLRDQFRKAMQLRNTSRGGDTSILKKPWKLEKEMNFLIPYIKDKTQISSSSQSNSEMVFVKCEVKDYEDPELPEDPIPVTTRSVPSPVQTTSSSSFLPVSAQSKTKNVKKMRKGSPDSVSSILAKYLEDKKEKDKMATTKSDPITLFFISMAEIVKTLPPHSQLEVKSKVFEVISQAELSALNSE